MTDAIETAADPLTGTLAAAAVEPKQDVPVPAAVAPSTEAELAEPQPAEPQLAEPQLAEARPAEAQSPVAQSARVCLNCGVDLAGKYCAACGQPEHLHRTLASMAHDLVYSIFHLDGKLWRTIPELALFPGRLTRRYIHGERAKFVSPMAFYLFSVFLTYAVFSLVGGGASTGETAALEATRERIEDLKEDIDDAGVSAAEREAMSREIAELEAQRGALEAAARDPAPTAGILGFRDLQRAALDAKRRELESLEQQLEETSLPADRRLEIARQMATLEAERTVIDAVARGDWELLEELDEDAIAARDEAAPTARERGAPEGALERGARELQSNPNLMWYKLKSNAYKYPWLLVPLSIPFMWLLFFWRRDIHLYDHAVFVTYSISFMLLLLVVAVLAQLVGVSSALVGQIYVVAALVHMYRQLRGAYLLSVPGTLLRLFLLLFAQLIVLTLFASVLFVIGALE